jgi:hypothetical protein
LFEGSFPFGKIWISRGRVRHRDGIIGTRRQPCQPAQRRSSKATFDC